MHPKEILLASKKLSQILIQHKNILGKVMDIPKNVFIFDFTENNIDLESLDINSTEIFTDYVFETLKRNNCAVGIGRYNEDRIIYKRSQLFSGEEEPRSLHLGIDIWSETSTPIFSPLPGKIHSFHDNNQFGDYGPTIILEHNLEGITFYTLYGHLSRESLASLYEGKNIFQGEQIATAGDSLVNGHWPPHLHFEIIVDMLGKKGDFFGVARPSEKEYYLALCPDPNLILNIEKLN